jgi:hypothetical protein
MDDVVLHGSLGEVQRCCDLTVRQSLGHKVRDLVLAVVLALGIYVFLPLTPAIMGPFVAGRLAIGGWMLLFAVLGLGLTRVRRPEEQLAR